MNLLRVNAMGHDATYARREYHASVRVSRTRSCSISLAQLYSGPSLGHTPSAGHPVGRAPPAHRLDFVRTACMPLER